jgi:tetratricopeptide (TPR) repeat protein
MWIKDSNNDLLMFNIQKNNYAASKKEKYNFNSILENIMIKGRAEVQKLYNQNKYNAAINKAEILIMMLGEIVKNDTLNKELSQLYQDLAILYAKLNKLEESIEAINKAILLNPSTQNEEILTLIKK